MTDFVLPTTVYPADVEWSLVDYSTMFPNTFGGAPKTYDRGQRWRAIVRYKNLANADRAAMAAFVAAMRGKANRAWLWDPGYQQRGSFAASELQPVTSFTSLTNGRITYAANAPSGLGVGSASAATLVQYAPYIMRAMLQAGRGALATGDVRLGSTSGAGDLGSATQPAPGLLSGSIVASVVSGYLGLANYAGTNVAGDYFVVPYTSLQRCGLVDTGPNLFLQSNALGTSPWTVASGTLAGLNASSAPDGSATDQYLIEQNTSNIEHYTDQVVTVPSAVADFTYSCSVLAATRSWLLLRMQENIAGHDFRIWFNAATGAFGTVTTTGGNWTNLRTVAVSQGGGWYRVTVTARKASAATSITCLLESATGDLVFNYAGASSAVALRLWHASLAQSGAPTRDSLTTSSSLAAGVSPTGSSCYVKGLPASSTGLILSGDMLEINGELKRAIADLNSDAAGIGYLQFEPALRSSSIPDGAPIVFGRPMGKFVMPDGGSQPTRPGFFSDFALTFDEAA